MPYADHFAKMTGEQRAVLRRNDRERKRKRYATDPEYRAKVKSRCRKYHRRKIADDPVFRACCSLRSQEYNATHREQMLAIQRKSYHKRRAAGLAEMDQIVAELGGTPIV